MSTLTDSSTTRAFTLPRQRTLHPPLLLALLSPLLCAACAASAPAGPAPPAPPPASGAQAAGPPPTAAPPAFQPQGGFTPYRSRNLFAAGTVFKGTYVCNQGPTNMTLRITAVEGPLVRGIFEFHHEPTKIRGSFFFEGESKQGGLARFEPTQWIEHPPTYTSVPFSGELSEDGLQFSGVIEHSSCRGFDVRRIDPKATP